MTHEMEKKWLLGIPVAALVAFVAYKHFATRGMVNPIASVIQTTRKGVPITPEMESEYKPATRSQVRMF